MARKRGGGRKFPSRYLRGQVDEEVALSTLAGETLISAAFSDSVTEQARISSLVAAYALSGMTPAASDGPIMVGVALSVYTDAQIEEFLEQQDSWEEGDQVAKEVSSRMIRRVGVFTNPPLAVDFAALNDGKPIKTKLNWPLTTGQTLKLWAYNLGTSTLTTGAIVHATGHANIWPQ